MGSHRSNASAKERLKWTKELHDLFEEAVHQMGGPDKGKLERRSISEMLPNFCALSGAQLNEALLIQMEAQRRLKSLKMKIEAQGRFLDKIMEEYKTQFANPIISDLPSLSEESDQSDLEDVGEEEFRAPKRIKNNQQPKLIPSSFHLNSLDGIGKGLYGDPEIRFPRGVVAAAAVSDNE